MWCSRKSTGLGSRRPVPHSAAPPNDLQARRLSSLCQIVHIRKMKALYWVIIKVPLLKHYDDFSYSSNIEWEKMYRVCFGKKKKNKAFLQLGIKQNLRTFIQSMMLAFGFNAYLSFLPFAKPIVSCLFLAVFKYQL